MQIEIDDDVVLERTVHKRKRAVSASESVPAALKRCVDAYKQAYARVYGIVPEITFSRGYVRVKGNETGVTKKRLREMTIQLRWRAG